MNEKPKETRARVYLRRAVMAALDAAIVAFSFYFALLLRADGAVEAAWWPHNLAILYHNLPWIVAVYVASFLLGGLYLSGLSEAIIVSMGTGTALVHAKRRKDGGTDIDYLGGTGVGGGTLLGLTKKMLGVDTVAHIEQLCEDGDLSKVDLTIKDISRNDQFPGVNYNLTAANFGKLSDLADSSDIALGIANMVAETIAMMAIFAARGHGVRDIVLTGNLTTIRPIRRVFEGLRDLSLIHI